MSRTLDHVGAFARSLDDTALLLDVIAGYDPRDPDTRPVSTAHFAPCRRRSRRFTPRFAFVRTPIWEQADGTTARKRFEDLAARLGDAASPSICRNVIAGAWSAQRTIMAVEMAHNLGSHSWTGWRCGQ